MPTLLTNWNRSADSKPEVVVHPKSVAELQEIVHRLMLLVLEREKVRPRILIDRRHDQSRALGAAV